MGLLRRLELKNEIDLTAPDITRKQRHCRRATTIRLQNFPDKIQQCVCLAARVCA